jgi:cytochrome c peroxidase
MCHIPEQGFTSNELATAVGIEGRTVRRNSPTLYNVGYLRRLFHDARETTLEQQVWAPILARNEMGNPSIGYVIEKIKALVDYNRLFEGAFNGRGPTMETIGMGLASYQRTLISGASGFDRWYYAGEAEAMSIGAQRGFSLFVGKAGCASCHTIDSNHALFTDQGMHNTGIGYRQSMGSEPEMRRVQLAPGVFADVATASYTAAAEKPPADLGLYEITQDPADRWRYRTPSLRNVVLTAPYMHDGSLKTLREVVAFYNRGGIPNENLDPLIRPLGLNEEEVTAVVSFLESLTGANVDVLLGDAFSAPIGDRSREKAD